LTSIESTSRVGLTDNNEKAAKYVLYFHQQNQQQQQPGIAVDISTLTGYLCVENNSIVAANSRTAPTDKFLIIPVGVE
jgi:hypothetical protein